MAEVSPELLSVMACPVSHKPLVEVEGWLYSTDPETRRKYPIRDGIPIMLTEESVVVDVDEYARAMALSGREPADRDGISAD